MNYDAELQKLIDIQSIRDLVMRYCRAVDRRNLEQLRELYHEDAIDDHGRLANCPAGQYIDILPKILRKMQATSHQIMNHYVVVDGDYAEGESYVIAYHLTKDEQGKDIEWIAGGRYLDIYEKRAGVWKFKYRKIVADWNQIQPSLSHWEAPMFAGSARGTVYDADPSWTVFRLIGKQGR
jgi:hypothetical protein